MKRMTLCLLTVLLVLTLSSCSAKKPGMYIEPAQLNKDEQALMKLVGEDSRLFDFKLDGEAKSVKICVYRLENGAWALSSGGGEFVNRGKEGRLALTFEKLSDGIRVAVADDGAVSMERKVPEEMDLKNFSRATAALSACKKVSWGEEIPLVMQIFSTKDVVSDYGPENFFTPEKLDYEHAYAVTVTFTK